MDISRTKSQALKAVSAVVCAAVVLGGSATALAATAPSSAGRTSAQLSVHSVRGSIVSAQRVQQLSPQDVTAVLNENEFDTSQVRYGVDAYRIVYRTIDVNGRPSTASGLVVLPRNNERRLRVINYTHGTMSGADEAPSVDDNGKSPEGLQLGSAGYAVVAPDYLGLGLGPGPHPYMHGASETSASVDLLRAAFTFSYRVHRNFDQRILVTGFSQGSAAAMFIGKALQSGAVPGLRLAALAPISGPYDVAHAEIPAVFDGRLDSKDSAFYVAYLLTAWNSIYHLYDSPSEVFQAPYDKTVAPLYNGQHDEGEIFAALPDSVQQLLTPKFLDLVQHPTGRFAAALRTNDASCTGWAPRVPIRIYAAHSDEQVAIANAYSCQNSLARQGVPAPVVDLGDYGHLDSGRHGLTAALQWFERIAPPQD
jgi:predicted esterase